MDSNHNKQYQKLSYYRYTKWEKSIVGASILAVTTRFICFAESQGFEPQNLLQLPVFKTGAFNHSAIFPFNLAPSPGRVPFKVLLLTIHAWTGILSLVGGILLRFSPEPRYGLEPQTC